MTPEIKAALTYFALFLLVGCGMIIQGYNLKKKKSESPFNTNETTSNNGPLLMVIGVLMIVFQAYELYEKIG